MIQENLVKYFEDSIKANWDTLALSDYKGIDYSYADVAVQIKKWHLLFEARGIKPGDKIALIGKNSANWGIVFLSVVTYGAVIVPLLPDFKPRDVHALVNHSDSRLFFASDAIFEQLDMNQMPAIECVFSVDNHQVCYRKTDHPNGVADKEILFQETYPKGIRAETFSLPQIGNDKLAMISYTSGTTGNSKGVMLLHNSLAGNVKFARDHMPLQSADRIVSFLPQAHTYGLLFEFLFPFSLGCHITFLTKTPSPKIITQAFAEVRPRLILSVPLVIEKIYKAQILPAIQKPYMKVLMAIPGVKNLIRKKIREKITGVFGGNFHELVIGGAPFNAEAESFFRKLKFPITVGYGMTECGPLVSYASWKENRCHASGRSVDLLEVKIDSEDPENVAGEILMRGDHVMTGYYKNPEATAKAIDEDGWLHSGDLGVIDKDGFIYIKGRNKSMILGPSGQNIYPEEIESIINNQECVVESLVLEKNNKLHALVYLDPDCIREEEMDEKAIRQHLEHLRKHVNHHTPAYMNITRFEHQKETFEKTPKQSIKRYKYTAA